MKPKVYLAGPISGHSYGGATSWREYARDAFERLDIEAFSPLRYQPHLAAVDAFTQLGDETARLDNPMSLPRTFTRRDRWDATRCDLMLVNLIGAKAVSIGTVMEIAWADERRIPIVLAMEARGNPHQHAMINEVAWSRVPTINAAIALSRAMLKP